MHCKTVFHIIINSLAGLIFLQASPVSAQEQYILSEPQVQPPPSPFLSEGDSLTWAVSVTGADSSHSAEAIAQAKAGNPDALSSAEFASAQQFQSDYSTRLDFQVTQICASGGSFTFWVYYTISGGNQVLSKTQTWGFLVWGANITGFLNINAGPAEVVSFRVVRRATGLFCDDTRTLTATGRTSSLKAPTSLRASTGGSDKQVTLTWNKGTDIPPNGPFGYYIYKNGTFHSSINSSKSTGISSMVSTTPDKTDKWEVATRFYGFTTNPAQTSARVAVNATTAPYKVPGNFTASEDTTVGYVRLTWSNQSDYATHVRIYRDDALIATLAKTLGVYLDTGALPGVEYVYKITSYNSSTVLESAPATEKPTGRAFFFTASDGSENIRVKLSWTKIPSSYGFASKVRIERGNNDQVWLEFILKGTVDDKDALPGKLHEYTISVLDEDGNEVLNDIDHGFMPANGQISGTVKTPGATTGGGVQDILVLAQPTADTLSKSLGLDGTDDFVTVRHTQQLSLTGNMTVEFWVKLNALPTDAFSFISKRAAAGNSTLNYMLAMNNDRTFRFLTGAAGNLVSSSTVAEAGTWYHVAGVQDADSGKIRIYVNGFLEGEQPLSSADVTNDAQLFIGRDEAGRFVDGAMDEVRLWNIARSDSAIQADMQSNLLGDEAGLVAYWPFTPGVANIAGDFSMNGGHHGDIAGNAALLSNVPDMKYATLTDDRGEGAYRLSGIYYANGSEFKIYPSKAGHGFDSPDTLFRTLENIPPDGWVATANFIDTTSFSISGKVTFFSEPACGAAGVQILINGIASGVTDASGNFSVSVSQAGKYKLTALLGNHTFEPAEINLDVTGHVDGLIFLDQQTVTLSGKVLGGCDNFIGAADIAIRSLDPAVCYTQIVTTDIDGNYSIILPAQEYAVSLQGIANPDSAAILAYFKTDTLDLTFSDSTHDYIYHAPPQVSIAGFKIFGCNGFADVPIMRQFLTDTLTISIFERYIFNGQETICPVDSGTLTLDDRISDDALETSISFQNGEAKYALTPGVPNILADNPAHPYQKRLTLTANVERYTVADTTWALVTGHKPRPGEPFSTVSPQLPLMILRDPPGDQSYSYLEKETSITLGIGLSFAVDASLTLFAEAKVGAGGDVPGVGSTGGFVKVGASLEIGGSIATESSIDLTITARERLSTSDNEQITGTSGDVFVGAAYNVTYGITDVLKYNCEVEISQALVWGSNDFATRYFYTENYIRDSLIPELQFLADNAPSDDHAARFLDAIEVWQQLLQLNEQYKTEAQVVKQNISFSGNLGVEESLTVIQTISTAIEFNMYIEQSVAVSVGYKAGDFNDLEGGVKVRAKYSFGASLSGSVSKTATVGYFLGDDDAGDDFTLNIKGGPVYGTPVFQLIAGTSSNPWEGLPSQPRDGLTLSVDPAQRTDISPSESAIFNLRLFNTSPSNETREYLLSLVQSSNPGGARIRTGDQFVESLRYTIPAQQFQQVTIDVARLPGHPFDYDSLQVRMFAENDPQFADTVAFSVNFIKPCSEVSLISPAQNWSVTQVSGEFVPVVLTDYDATDPGLNFLRLEYSEDEVEWHVINDFSAGSLPLDTLKYDWDVASRPNGVYSVRAIANCASGENFSVAVKGFIDRGSWLTRLVISDAAGSGNMETVSFGQSAMATAGLDVELGESELPPLPPAGVFYAAFDLPTQPVAASLTDLRNSDNLNVTWRLKFQPGAGGYPMMLKWDTASFPAGDFRLRDIITGDIVNVDMKLQESFLLDNTAITGLNVEFISSFACQDVTVAQGWNIIAVPLESNDMFQATLFPTAVSKAFSFNNGYQVDALLRSGAGYWLKFDAADTLEVCGTQHADNKITAQEGWNIIGPFDKQIAVSQITTTPPGIITSQFFGYNNGYVIADSLASGRGYWVKMAQNGILNLNSGTTLAKKERKSALMTAATVDASWGLIRISDSVGNETVLYVAGNDAETGDFTLPPAPPAGVFDARYASDRYVATMKDKIETIILNSAVFPVTIAVEGMDIRIKDNITGDLVDKVIRSNSSVELVNPAITSLMISEESIPETFDLLQNYPNPFNPSTTIKFNLPESGRVKLSVYNILGELVTELIDKEMEAGSYNFQFNATQYASGVYIYRISAGKFNAAKKMLLIK